MNRRGKYTKRLSFWQWSTRGVRHQWKRFKGVSRKKKILYIGGPIVAFLLLTPLITYAYFARDIANPDRLMNSNNTGVVLLDRHGKEFYSAGNAKHRKALPLSQISDSMKNALIAAEDKNFYEHPGFSIGNILGALYANFINADATAYGGSTLTQQLAKNTLLTSDQNILRKYQELSIAIAIEQNYSKDEILELYLNSVYYGEGAFGIRDAARIYFSKVPKDLTLAESAMLVGVLPAPSAYSPVTGSKEMAKERQTTVLSRMVKNGVITETQKQQASSAKLSYAPSQIAVSAEAPHFAEMILADLHEKYGEEKVRRSGFQVKTSLDLEWQKKANEVVANQLPTILAGNGSNAGVVGIDPNNGEVRVLIGSVDWDNKEFGKVNMATTPRQPGSSFKPIYYTEAMNQRLITPATILRDEPTKWGSYAPNNFDFAFRGNISARNALAQSLNIPAVKVMEKLGVEDAVAAAKRMGITTITDPDKYGLSLALGAAETKLIEMTNAYAAFANEGEQFEPTKIVNIKNKYDETIFTAEEKSREVTSTGAAYLISNILSDDVARAPTFGSRITIYNRDVAVKTGTTDDDRDAWTIGYTPQIAVGVWVGNNDNRVMTIGGSGMAGPIWKGTMLAILEDKDNEPFRQPASVQKILICANGLRASRSGPGTYSEYFLRGSGPTGTCDVPKEKKPEPKPEPQPQTPTPDTSTEEPEPDTTVEPPAEEEPEDPIPDPELPGDGTTPGNGGTNPGGG